MNATAHPPETVEGWYALHQIYRLNAAALQSTPPAERAALRARAVLALDELSAPVDGVFTYLNMVQTFQWQPEGQLFGGYYPLEGLGSRLMPSVPLLQPHLASYWLTSDPSVRMSRYSIARPREHSNLHIAAMSLLPVRTKAMSRNVASSQ